MKHKKDWRDPIVEEIRKHADEYAAKFDYDLDAIFLDLKRQEAESDRPVVSLNPGESRSSAKRPRTNR